MTQEEIKSVKKQAREYGIPEDEVLRAWEEMKEKYRLPWYVEPTLAARSNVAVLLPAVNINLLSRLDKEVPSWESISGPEWKLKEA